MTNSLESILKKYDEPLVQSQVDDLYDSARVYIKRLKNEFTDAQNVLQSKYFDAIRNAGLNDDKKLAKELGITQKQYDNLKSALEDAEKKENDWDLDNIDKAPKISLDNYKSNDDLNEFDDMFDTVYKIVDAVSDAKLYNCTKIYSDLSKLKKTVNNFKFDDSNIITVKDYSAKYTNKSITYTIEDSGSDKATMQLMTYIIMIVIAFLFAVTTSNTITK